MPLSDPNRYRDKTADRMAWFMRTRQRALRPHVTPELIAEHARDPSGGMTRHSAQLQEVLNLLRSAPTVGKPFAYIEVPYKRYRIGRMRGRGHAPDLARGPVYDNERAAIHAVFLARLDWLGLLPRSHRNKRAEGAWS